MQRAPGNYRKLARLGAYGSFIKYYICGITLRVTDLQGRTAVFPWIKQDDRKVRGARCLSTADPNSIRAGFIGVVLVLLVIAVGLQPERLISWATAVRYQAKFAEAGGLLSGNDVTVSGIKVGAVHDVSLDNGDALVTFTVKGKVPLGSETTAHIRTGSLLGERVLTLESAGDGTMHPHRRDPGHRARRRRIRSPMRSSDLTTNIAGHRHRLAQSVTGHAVRRRSIRSRRNSVRRSTG